MLWTLKETVFPIKSLLSLSLPPTPPPPFHCLLHLGGKRDRWKKLSLNLAEGMLTRHLGLLAVTWHQAAFIQLFHLHRQTPYTIPACIFHLTWFGYNRFFKMYIFLSATGQLSLVRHPFRVSRRWVSLPSRRPPLSMCRQQVFTFAKPLKLLFPPARDDDLRRLYHFVIAHFIASNEAWQLPIPGTRGWLDSASPLCATVFQKQYLWRCMSKKKKKAAKFSRKPFSINEL